MKKITTIFLSVLVLVLTLAMVVSATAIQKDEKGIAMLDWLDFSPESTAHWAGFNAETQKWESLITFKNGSWQQPTDDNWNPTGTYLRGYSSYSGGTWSLIEGGEVLHYEATTSNVYPGLSFIIDDSAAACMPIGSETATTPKAEFVKVRVRNYSTATRMTFGFATNNTNRGTFMTLSISDLTVDANGKTYKSGTGEWETYVFSMPDIQVATNYGSQLVTDSEGNLQSRWGGSLYEFLVFPFGYNVTDGTGSYIGAAMDIDYIVIGSRDYVTNYKSKLEQKEESIKDLELVTEPTNKSYYVGETIDLDGLKLKATYNDGSVEYLDSASTKVNLAEKADSTPVTLTFGSKSVSYNVKVTGIDKIELIEEPESKTYERASVVSSFNYSGYKFKVTYADGTTNDDVPASAFRYNGDFTTPGTKDVAVTYYTATTTIHDVNVIDVVDFRIEAKKTFKYGDTITKDNLNIYYIYNDGTEKLHGADDTKTSLTLTIEATVGAPGATPVKVNGISSTLGTDITKELSVDVMAPVQMRIKQEPNKMTYQVGEKLDTLGMIVELVFEDESTVIMKEEDIKCRADFSSPDSNKVRVLSNVEGIDLETSFNVTVEGEVLPPETSNPPTSSTKPTPSSDSSSVGLIIGIVASVVVIVAVVVVVLLSKKKKSANG